MRWALEATQEADADRPGSTDTLLVGFLVRPAVIDGVFFGLSPREALGTEPERRLRLVSPWVALVSAV
ncbi:hypothetical protein PUR61_00710, partial [Streptomyces sp. BE20]|nr:hypothetical protein [Streptomyces sp. BE20]